MAAGSSTAQADLTSRKDVIAILNRVLNTRSTYVASQYISDNIVMEWFGRTIVGRSNVLNFLFEEANVFDHDIIEVKKPKQVYAPCRALKRFRQPLTPEKEEDFDMDDDSGFGSGSYESSDSSFCSSGSLTPSQKVAMDMTRLHLTKHNEDDELAQMPVHQSFRTPLNTRLPSTKHPRQKRQAALLHRLKEVDLPRNLEFVDGAGIISFRVDGDFYNPGNTWCKPCHIKIGYQQGNSPEELLFCFLLYNNDMPCRRNLSEVFDQCE